MYSSIEDRIIFRRKFTVSRNFCSICSRCVRTTQWRKNSFRSRFSSIVQSSSSTLAVPSIARFRTFFRRLLFLILLYNEPFCFDLSYKFSWRRWDCEFGINTWPFMKKNLPENKPTKRKLIFTKTSFTWLNSTELDNCERHSEFNVLFCFEMNVPTPPLPHAKWQKKMRDRTVIHSFIFAFLWLKWKSQFSSIFLILLLLYHFSRLKQLFNRIFVAFIWFHFNVFLFWFIINAIEWFYLSHLAPFVIFFFWFLKYKYNLFSLSLFFPFHISYGLQQNKKSNKKKHWKF